MVDGIEVGSCMVGWVVGKIEVVGGGLRDRPAVNERTLTGPVRLVVSIALLS